MIISDRKVYYKKL